MSRQKLSSESMSELEIKFKTLTLKKEYIFGKLQRIYNLSQTVENNESVRERFLIQYSELENMRKEFENVVMSLISIELELEPKSQPSTSALDSFDELLYNCKLTASKIKIDQDANVKNVRTNFYDTNSVRPSLPKISLFEFDGEIENWPTFYDTFVSLVHKRNFEEVDKFHYLLSCVRGPALNLVKSLPITAANYSLVWKSLLEKYQDERALIGRYLNKLLNFTQLNKSNISNLTSFIETFDQSYKAIQALNVPNLEDYLFCHIALRGLDNHTKQLFEQGRDQDILPTFGELMNFVQKQIKVLEHVFPTSSSHAITQKSFNNKSTHKNSPKSALQVNRVNNNYKHKPQINKQYCFHCNLDHMIYRCEQFRKLPINDRIDRVNALKLCANCLKNNHDIKNCQSTMSCGVCMLRHHYLLHQDRHTSAAAVPSTSHSALAAHSVSDAAVGVHVPHSVNGFADYNVVLGTARAHIADASGQYLDCRAVLDSGAQSSFITLSAAQRLGLRRKKCPFTVCGLGGKVIKTFGIVPCTIKPRFADVPTFVVDMVVVDKVASEMPNVLFPESVIKTYGEYNLADPYFYKKSHIDVLFGNDLVSDLVRDKPLQINTKLPNLINTVFGFVVSGKLYSNINNSKNINLINLKLDEVSLDKTLRSFWEIEEMPCIPASSPLDQLAEDIFVREHTRDATGRYVVPLLLRPGHAPLGESRAAAERRLRSTERRLARSPDLHRTYIEFMKEYEALDHMNIYNGESSSKYLIPHHSICRPSSTSTPVRVVFDGSAKTTANLSLNDILLTGPKLYRDITSIIINFRLFKYCFSSDICKMYRAILIRPSDRIYQHILFRESTEEPIKEYELKTVTYGLSCSPYLAIRTLLQLASDEGERFPSAARVIREGIYMDDVLWSCETFSQAVELQNQLIDLLKCGGFILKKWSSNCVDLLERVPSDYRVDPIAFESDNSDFSIKILGLQWAPSCDEFNFFVNKTDSVTTKRSVLKLLASIYDPVGFIAPCTFVAKCIMQDLWKLGVGWDEKLPLDVCDRWLTFIEELPRLSELHIERHAVLPSVTSCELVGFCDASSRGYAACIYIRSCDDQGAVKIRLLIAKSKVAPVKPVTIPRLELMSAVLLSNLMKFIKTTLTRIKLNKIIALTDSTIVLSWLQTEAYKLKTFVSNRVAQIIDIIPPSNWYHISSENNLADIGSRGASPAQLIQVGQQWLEGSTWLYGDRENWPVSALTVKSNSEIPELKLNNNTFNLLVQSDESLVEYCENIFNKFSSFSKLQRSFAWLLRFVHRVQRNVSVATQTTLNTCELKQSQDVLIRLIQRAYFGEEIKLLCKGSTYIPSLRKLAPFIDDHGFLRVGGRLSNAELPYNRKHPLLLPKKSRFTKLLIEYFHKKYLHVGPRTLQHLLNQKFWILCARSVIRSILSKCMVCFKAKPPSIQPEMAALPPSRLLPNRVFEHVGVDLGGPFFIKQSLRRNAKVDKAYLCLFICFSTKAVHLEVVTSLSADCFLATLDRFVARRGLCTCLYSDCGTNFIAAGKHLTEIQKTFKDSKFQTELIGGCAERQITWKFNPPSAPSMGGLWEAGIKSAKYHLVRAVGEKALTFEELSTVFCKIEAIMNSRPLSSLSSDPSEFDALTPGHFLIGRHLTAVPEYCIQELPTSHLSRWQYLQHCSQQFWRKWSSEYLNTLQQRAKWFTSPPNLKVGDLVLVKNDQTTSCNWPLARVVKIHPGKDGIVRCVTIRTQKSMVQRPVNKLSPLPYNN